MSEPTIYDVAAQRPRDPQWALAPGETYPPAPPLWVYEGCTCTLCADDPAHVLDTLCADDPAHVLETFSGSGEGLVAWRRVWPPAQVAR